MKFTFKFIVATFILLSFTSFCKGKRFSDEKIKFKDIIKTQVELYPQMQIQDYYKLIYQAVFGSAHMGMDSIMAQQWFDKEWADTPENKAEKYADTISPNGRIIRVNISSYKASGGSKEKLFTAFLYTSKNYTGSKTEFYKLWHYLESFSSITGYSKKSFAEYLKNMKAKGLPAAHHSEIYERLYKPSYRVVLVSEMK